MHHEENPMLPMIRPARPDEAEALSELMLRSKAHWGYSAEFIEACRPVLRFTPEYIASNPVYVIEDGEGVQGVYSLRDLGVLRSLGGRAVDLDVLFIEPRAIGRSYGRRLWLHAVEQAQALGYRHMMVEADPNAEDFYAKMGMTRIGERESTVEAGRMLPLLGYSL
jgi:GNAT superfamily N-acetyltransferase